MLSQDIIQLLPDHVANQIAAGEVVQRPASVVKELLENAVDAGATQIDLMAKEAGRTLVQVVDNGSGMSVTDLRMAFERHATSKIRTTEDIFSIHTKGFRGEALASIAAVSQVDAVSKKDMDELGNQIIIDGGDVKDQMVVTSKSGTSISVKNLFYNVPARRKFLKSNQVEIKHIQEEFLRVALAHEHISFRFFHNDSEVYHLNSSNLKQRIVQIFGRKIESQLVPVYEKTENISLSGFVGKPETSKKQRGEQYFFVNQRFIRSNYLHKAVMDAFENLLPNGYFPSYFLYLELDPSKIDINIHPTKTEIKFEDEPSIYAVMRSAVKRSLGQFNIMPSLDFEQDPDWAFIPSVKSDQSVRSPEIRVDRNYNPFTDRVSKNEISPVKTFYQSVSEFEIENNHPEFLLNKDELQFTQNEIEVFQWQNKYLVTSFAGKLLVIDQHRAHQRILYENFLRLSSGNALSQRLLFPVEIELNSQEITQLKNIELELVKFGFDVEFESEKIAIQALPSEISAESLQHVFADFLQELDWHESISFQKDISKIIAKNAAVKKGDFLNAEQSKHLAQELLQLNEPNYSPYGKSIFIELDIHDIKKKLK